MINLNKKNIRKWIAPQINNVGLLAVIYCLLNAGCQHKKVIYTPRGYNITKPDVTELGTKLREISGLCWVNDTTILANNDEAGKIFAINPKDKNNYDYRNVRFGKKDDYEDIVKVDSSIYVLISPGQLVEVKQYYDPENIQADVVADLPGKNEFESLYFDKSVNSIIMLCKDCHKEKDQVRSAYRFDLATHQLIDTPYYTIDLNMLKKKLQDSRAEFRPSAAAINPVDQKLYILSSIGKLLVITDLKGNIDQAIPISGTMFPQPEGITFAPNGDMYISNEAAQEERSSLLKFTYGKAK
jgi:hypothetical protein